MTWPQVILGLVFFVCANAVVLVLILPVWSRLRSDHIELDLAALIFVHILACTTLVLALGILGLLRPAWLLGIPVTILGLGLTVCRARFASGWRDLRSACARCRELAARRKAFALFCAGAFAVVHAEFFRKAWDFPPVIWDVLTYHLPKVASWVQNGNLLVPSSPITRMFWPSTFELYQTWWSVFPHHDLLIELAGVPFYAVAVLAVCRLARWAGCGRKGSVLAGLAYGLTPVLMLNVTSCKNDMPLAAMFLFTSACWVSVARARCPVGAVAFGAAALLFGMGVKAYIVFMAPGLIFVIPVAVDGLRTAFRSRNVLLWGTLAVLLLPACLCGGYWYVRNAVLFNNPVYPADFSIGDSLIFGDGRGKVWQQGSFSLESLVMTADDLVRDRLWNRGAYAVDATFQTGWGWFFATIGIPSMLFMAWRRRPLLRLTAVWVLSFCLLFCFVAHDSCNMRFSQWAPAIGVISACLCFYALRSGGIRMAFSMLSVATLCLNFAGSVLPIEMDYYSWRTQGRLPVLRRTAAPWAQVRALKIIPADEPIGLVTGGNSWAYPLYTPSFTRRVIYLDIERNQDIVPQLVRQGVRYALLYDIADDHKAVKLARSAVAAGRFEDLGGGVYRLRRRLP